MPSLAVSRRLGYIENGVSLSGSPTGVVELQHLRLTPERWTAHAVKVTGMDACLAWFGISDYQHREDRHQNETMTRRIDGKPRHPWEGR